ncbi:MAG: response regulator [Acidobacteriota bacterium]|nr:response regulator [Acidobacteriota bacterium]
MSKLVLIVEDSESCAETLQIAIEAAAGLEAQVVESPSAALKVARGGGREVAAVVTDLHLRQSDGLALIRQMRAAPELARIPILLISGDTDPMLPERALSQGADAFFSKPYSPAAVRRKLEELLL